MGRAQRNPSPRDPWVSRRWVSPLALPILRVLSQGGGSRLQPLLQLAEHQDNDMLDEILQHLTALVSFDTHNQPRRIGVGGISANLRATRSDFRVDVTARGPRQDIVRASGRQSGCRSGY